VPLSVLGSATAVFVIMRVLPGDPVESILAQAGASPAVVREWQREYHLLSPVPVQYCHYLRALLRGDLGTSILSGRKVVALIAEQLPSTVALASASLVFSLVIGGGLGLLGALRHSTYLDSFCRLFAVASVSVPVFWTGLLAIMVFGARLRWLPVVGDDSLRHLIMPTLVLGLSSSGVTARVVRSSLLEATRQDYVRVARAKGLSPRALTVRHLVRSSAAPIVTFLGLQAGFLLSGTAIVETVFTRRGLGRLLVEAILAKDYPVVQGCVLLVAVIYALANAVSDLVAAWVDPRVRER